MKRFSISKSKTWIAERIGSRSMSKSEEGVEVVSFEADLRDSGRSTEEVMIPQTSKYPGLTALTAAGAGLPGAEIYPVDIISIHGLNGDSFTTWTHKNGRLWLRDFLPADLPGCRVFTYGYPSQIWSHSIAGVRVYAGRLLDLIRDIQDAEREEGLRRIIFVCHSLGGIVCKQALVTAHEETSNPRNTRFLQSIAGVIFFGTPHRGSAVGNLGSVVGKIINAALLTKHVRTDHLDLLATGSTALQDLSESVRDRLADLKVVSFFETEPEESIMKIVVERDSAILSIAGEEIVGLYSTHREMCRFPDRKNAEYERVLSALKRISAHEPGRSLAGNRTSTLSLQKTWNDIKPCLSLFSRFDPSNYRAMLPSPVEGTCKWILGHKIFTSWLEKAENALLWLTGHSGCGKTILSLFLAKQLENASLTGSPTSVCIFFCDDKISTQKLANNILIGLIYQLLCRNHSLARHVKVSYDTHDSNLVDSCEALWSLFKAIAADPKSGSIIIIIDALDECEDKTRRWLLREIKDFIRSEEYRLQGVGHRIKFVLTSRPNLGEIEKIMDATLDHRIAIDEDHGDVQLFIQQRVEEICKQRQFPDDAKRFLLESLNSRSGQTFLWVRMVLEQIEATDLLSYHELDTFLRKIPKRLELTYKGFVSRVNPLDAACKLLKLILGSSRHLDLDEINIAFTIEPKHQKVADLGPNLQMQMDRTLRGVLGPLIRISGSKVLLVHQSAKEFILGQLGDELEVPTEIRSIKANDCTLAIATACINYLLLTDFSQDIFHSITSSPDSASEADSGSIDAIETSSTSSADKLFWETGEEELNLDSFANEANVLDDDACELVTSRYPFYSYAALNWAEHFSLCEEIAPLELKESARRLLDTTTVNSSNSLRFYSSQITAGVETLPLRSFDFVTLAAFFNLHGLLKDHLASHCESDEKEPVPQRSLDDALFWAAERGHSRIVETLLNAKADPNAQQVLSDRMYQQTPLTIASKNGHIDSVSALLSDPRTEVNLQGNRGRTALSFACHARHKEIVELLLSKPDCDLDKADHSNSTPLIWAAGGAGDHSEIISLLANHQGFQAERGVNLDHCDKDGRTATSWAAGEGCIGALKTLLKGKRADPNIPDKTGRTPLSWAAGNGHADAVKILLKDSRVHRATMDKERRNPYSWACAAGHAEAIETLVKYGCPGADEPDENGWAPLAWVVQGPWPEAAQTLLNTPRNRKKGGVEAIDLERGDEGGTTALRWAVVYGHLEVVRVLLRAGADPLRQNKAGLTALDKAREMGRREVLEELERHLGVGTGSG